MYLVESKFLPIAPLDLELSFQMEFKKGAGWLDRDIFLINFDMKLRSCKNLGKKCEFGMFNLSAIVMEY